MKSQYQDLIKAAREAQARAHAPFSKFRVGAAILDTHDRIHSGFNIESSSYGLTMCAERVAIFGAMASGMSNFKAMALVSDDPGFTPPCGACRQVVFDLAGDIDFIMVNAKGRTKILKMKSLLPHSFSSENLTHNVNH